MLGLQESLSLEPNERVIAAVRSHTFRTIARTVPCIAVLFLLFLFLFPLFRLGWFGVAFFFLTLFTTVIVLLRTLIQWYGSVYLLTEHRLFCIDRQGFFKKKVNEIVLENVNELSYDTKGVLPMVFGYGDIQCSLFTTRGSYVIESISRPQDFLTLISKYVSKMKHSARSPSESNTIDPHSYEKKMLPFNSNHTPEK